MTVFIQLSHLVFSAEKAYQFDNADEEILNDWVVLVIHVHVNIFITSLLFLVVLFRTLTQFFVLLKSKVGEQMRAAFNVVDYLFQHLFVILDCFELKNFCCEFANRC